MKRVILCVLLLALVCLVTSGCSALDRVDTKVQTAKERYLEIRATYLEVRAAYLVARQAILDDWDDVPPSVQEVLIAADEKAREADVRLSDLDQKITTTYFTYEEVHAATTTALETIQMLSSALAVAAKRFN